MNVLNPAAAGRQKAKDLNENKNMYIYIYQDMGHPLSNNQLFGKDVSQDCPMNEGSHRSVQKSVQEECIFNLSLQEPKCLTRVPQDCLQIQSYKIVLQELASTECFALTITSQRSAYRSVLQNCSTRVFFQRVFHRNRPGGSFDNSVG